MNAPLLSLEEWGRAAQASATRIAYEGHWRRFRAWCEAQGLESLPAAPRTVALFLAARAAEGQAVSTMGQALAAIGDAHRRAGVPAPSSATDGVLRAVWLGIRRRRSSPPARKGAATLDVLAPMIARLPEGLIGVRDRALLLLGFAAATRRSELAALDVADVAIDTRGIVLRVRRSKTDAEGRGAFVGVARSSRTAQCAVRAVERWLDASGVADGALLRAVSRHGRVGERMSGRDVARRVKLAAERAGLDPALFGGHSLRAGLATEAARQGARTAEIMKQGRWKSAQLVEETYIRPHTVFDNAAARLL